MLAEEFDRSSTPRSRESIRGQRVMDEHFAGAAVGWVGYPLRAYDLAMGAMVFLSWVAWGWASGSRGWGIGGVEFSARDWSARGCAYTNFVADWAYDITAFRHVKHLV